MPSSLSFHAGLLMNDVDPAFRTILPEQVFGRQAGLQHNQVVRVGQVGAGKVGHLSINAVLSEPFQDRLLVTPKFISYGLS